ncbi:hypothetical protein [Enterococcus faecalis]|uniref:hypothetical protein n=1 Tax=Enterococcus faecalis TaxID=1351 RepID=UPI001D0A43B1|nr:hypothetical protein [Enterococcus faecalis]
MWDPSEKEKWIHSLPKNAITLENIDDGLKNIIHYQMVIPTDFFAIFKIGIKNNIPKVLYHVV